jgi:hypothetical protein
MFAAPLSGSGGERRRSSCGEALSRRRRVTRRQAAVAAAAWCVIFGALHVYWALGGRAGLGTFAGRADEALSTPWFWTYNAVIAVLSFGGAILAAATAMDTYLRGREFAQTVSRVAAGVLVLRGGLGTLLLLVDVVTEGLDTAPPLALLAVEPAFVVGGLAFAAVGRRDASQWQSHSALPQGPN